ncbi:ClpX C4-type zinc finger protein [Amycolatopsis sp. H20-H5]|uniref:ClpX C4-type zinc finger protein n=1 Tax=Amycolatopsis sp. H20-H5 TaxID=3046309 RepID=UPI002DB749B6|nr:ClpX C4-type zinc finger protein [Amycolatopsis sp. H20-H5]MEC3982541.1 ClpX C4-type zinc finger protein [Amycolatopsis sp. H20-H5]
MPDVRTEPAIASCSFCRKPNAEVEKLVAGPGVFICDGCVALASQVIAGAPESPSPVAPWDLEMTLDAVLAALGPVAAAGVQVERNLGLWVAKARSLKGTWSQIGQALGMTRQSAWERFSGEE